MDESVIYFEAFIAQCYQGRWSEIGKQTGIIFSSGYYKYEQFDMDVVDANKTCTSALLIVISQGQTFQQKLQTLPTLEFVQKPAAALGGSKPSNMTTQSPWCCKIISRLFC